MPFKVTTPLATPLSMNTQQFKAFRALIHQETGIWLRDGKQAMLASRLGRRMRHHGIDDFAAYLEFVQQVQDKGVEIGELINCITTNKTSFFREKHHFDFLVGTVLPEVLVEPPGRRRSLRIWSAACSTGEEAYTIAVALLDALEANRSLGLSEEGRRLAASFGPAPIEILASDIDTAVLKTAVRGVYPDTVLETIPVALHARYFLRGKGNMLGQVRVKPEITAVVQFEHINLMDHTWPLQPGLDAIFFRNALIYFDRQTQELFLRRMLRYLRPGGYLFLGHSENIPWLHDAVMPLQQTIFQLRSRPSGRNIAEPVDTSSTLKASL
jgi:chemotaxis protein methyltransferase CheR